MSKATINKIRHIWSMLRSEVWAIRPEKLNEIVEVLRLLAAGADVPFDPAREKPAQARNQ